MALRMRGGNLLEINAGGKKFNQVPLSKVRGQIPEERLEEFDAIISRYADPMLAEGGKIRTGDLEIVAGKLDMSDVLKPIYEAASKTLGRKFEYPAK